MGIPLDPFFEAARRMLEDQLQQQLAGINAQRPELLGANNLFMQRLGTNQNIDERHLNAGLVSHGLFNSGIRTTETGRMDTQYDRQRQDAAFDLAKALGGLSQQASGARLNYTQGLQEAQMDSARRLGQDPYAVLPKYRKTPGFPKPRKNPNRRPY